MIQVREISKWYGKIEALRGISFDIQSGEIVGLLGPNGAGKSTTIKIMTGFLHPDDGQVEIDGHSVLTETHMVQSKIGYLSENTPLYPELSVQSYLNLMAELRDIPDTKKLELLSSAVYATGMQDYLSRPISSLSKGLRQRVGLAQAILHKPEFLILDEPSIGLDPTQIVEIRHLIKRLAKDSTILFSSHILSEVEAICDRVIILMNGEVKADKRLQDLSMSNTATLVLQNKTNGIYESFAGIPSISRIQDFRTSDGYPAYRITSDADITPVIYNIARDHNWEVREIRRDIVTLESFFNQLAMSA